MIPLWYEFGDDAIERMEALDAIIDLEREASFADPPNYAADDIFDFWDSEQ